MLQFESAVRARSFDGQLGAGAHFWSIASDHFCASTADLALISAKRRVELVSRARRGYGLCGGMRTVFATLAIHHCHIFAGLLHATPGQLDNAKHLRVRLCRCRVRERVFGQLEMSLLVRRFPAALAARLLQRPFFRSVIPAATAATASAASASASTASAEAPPSPRAVQGAAGGEAELLLYRTGDLARLLPSAAAGGEASVQVLGRRPPDGSVELVYAFIHSQVHSLLGRRPPDGSLS
jgi:hypothetical protein